MSENANTQIEDWRSNVTPSKATCKIKDGESAVGHFRDEGVKKQSVDYGESIAFAFQIEGETEVKTFYVKANNFDLLNQIKTLGNLTGLKVKISRTGSKKSDTRYKIVKAE